MHLLHDYADERSQDDESSVDYIPLYVAGPVIPSPKKVNQAPPRQTPPDPELIGREALPRTPVSGRRTAKDLEAKASEEPFEARRLYAEPFYPLPEPYLYGA